MKTVIDLINQKPVYINGFENYTEDTILTDFVYINKKKYPNIKVLFASKKKYFMLFENDFSLYMTDNLTMNIQHSLLGNELVPLCNTESIKEYVLSMISDTNKLYSYINIDNLKYIPQLLDFIGEQETAKNIQLEIIKTHEYNLDKSKKRKEECENDIVYYQNRILDLNKSLEESNV